MAHGFLSWDSCSSWSVGPKRFIRESHVETPFMGVLAGSERLGSCWTRLLLMIHSRLHAGPTCEEPFVSCSTRQGAVTRGLENYTAVAFTKGFLTISRVSISRRYIPFGDKRWNKKARDVSYGHLLELLVSLVSTCDRPLKLFLRVVSCGHTFGSLFRD